MLPFSNALQNVPHVNLTYVAGNYFLVINLTLRNLSSGQLVKIFHFLNSTATPRHWLTSSRASKNFSESEDCRDMYESKRGILEPWWYDWLGVCLVGGATLGVPPRSEAGMSIPEASCWICERRSLSSVLWRRDWRRRSCWFDMMLSCWRRVELVCSTTYIWERERESEADTHTH